MEKKRLKIGFYNPYFDVPSGGERYTLTLASHWSKNHDVFLFWDDPKIVEFSEKRFGIDLTKVKTTPNIFVNSNIFGKLLNSRKYDIIFFLSDGSIPTSLAEHNILHFQVPFVSVTFDSWKMSRFDAIVCNSLFTKQELDPKVGDRSVVIYPPVRSINQSTRKNRQILSVGRFSGHLLTKKQDILIDAFVRGYKSGVFTDWNLVFVGALLPSDELFFQKLKQRARGFPIKFLPNATHDELTEYYQSSMIYWHAAGYGEKDPTRMEHFGISTVEAMSAGLVPFVYGAGGQLEIVNHGKDGYIWHTKQELMTLTNKIIDTPSKYSIVSKEAIARATDFTEEKFTRSFDALISHWQ